jgi:hypothetical protein
LSASLCHCPPFLNGTQFQAAEIDFLPLIHGVHVALRGIGADPALLPLCHRVMRRAGDPG